MLTAQRVVRTAANTCAVPVDRTCSKAWLGLAPPSCHFLEAQAVISPGTKA